MSQRRVVITGLGMLSPLGNSVSSTWSALLEGKSGIVPVTDFDPRDFGCRFAGLIKDFEPTDYMPAKEVRRMDTFIQYGFAASVQAMEDSGLEINDANAERIGVALGSGIGGLGSIEKTTRQIIESGPRKVSPFFIPGAIINMISGNVSIRYGLKGPNLAVVTACTTGTHNIGLAARLIASNDADVMLAGGAEKASTPTGLGGFSAAKALSTRNDDPTAASRPWDRDRDGFVLGDGAGTLILEEYEHAKRRGAHIYAELLGFGMSGDAHHITLPSGDGALLCMKNTFSDAGVAPENVQYVNAHATSTVAGDKMESETMHRLFGAHAKNLACSSTKSMTGHLLGAAGAVEAIFSILAIRDQVAPPTINLDNPDEACDLDYVPHTAREMSIDYALSNSFGFGGTNGSLLFARV